MRCFTEDGLRSRGLYEGNGLRENCCIWSLNAQPQTSMMDNPATPAWLVTGHRGTYPRTDTRYHTPLVLDYRQ